MLLSSFVTLSFVQFTIDWETREQWTEQLERREIIKFLRNNKYQTSKDGYSDYSMVEEYQCTRYGSITRRPKNDDQGNAIPFVPQRQRQHPSIKVGCTSTLKIKRLKYNPAKAQVVYYDEHTGHTPRTIEGLKSQRKSKNFIRLLKNLVNEGMDPEQILQKYSIDPSSVLDRVQSRIGIHPNDFVTKQSMYYILYERMISRPQLQPNDFNSLRKKAKAMQDEGYLVFNKEYPPQPPKSRGEDKNKSRANVNANSEAARETGTQTGTSETETTIGFCGVPLNAFGFLHPWQQLLLKKYGDSIGLDCLHQTTR